MLLFAILQLLATRASMLLPVAVIGLVTVPLVLVNVLTIDAPKPSTTMFSLDSVEAVMCSRQMGNGLYAASGFVHPMAGKLVKNVVLPYVCGSPEALVPPTTPSSYHEGLPIGDRVRRNASHLAHPGVSEHSEKDANKGVPRGIHPAFMALGLGLGVRGMCFILDFCKDLILATYLQPLVSIYCPCLSLQKNFRLGEAFADRPGSAHFIVSHPSYSLCALAHSPVTPRIQTCPSHSTPASSCRTLHAQSGSMSILCSRPRLSWSSS